MTEAELVAGVAPLLGEAEAHAASASPEPIDALAFATDAASEAALAAGLAHLSNAQAWGGGLRAGVEVLRQGETAPLVFVDLDGEAHPAGTLYELAAVCEEETAVMAFGTDATAAYCRAVLLAGVAEYLVKPLDPAEVREESAMNVRVSSFAAELPPAPSARRGAVSGGVGFAQALIPGEQLLAAVALEKPLADRVHSSWIGDVGQALGRPIRCFRAELPKRHPMHGIAPGLCSHREGHGGRNAGRAPVRCALASVRAAAIGSPPGRTGAGRGRERASAQGREGARRRALRIWRRCDGYDFAFPSGRGLR